MFLGNLFLRRFWESFWKAKIIDFRNCFIICRYKISNAIWKGKKLKKRPTKTMRHQFSSKTAACATLGERKKDRGKASCIMPSYMNSWPAVFAMLLSNALLKLGVCIWHARPALREAAETLRAFRRPHLGCLEAWRAEWLGSFENQLKIANIDLLDTQKSSFGEVWEACLRVLGYLG